ncbi:MAG: efflux RND transporter periplasmic adaptor subunit [bacterium]
MKIKSHAFSLLCLAVIALTTGIFLYPTINKGFAEKNVSNERHVTVVLSPARTRNFEERILVQGEVQAKNFAMVSPKIPGTIEKIFVHEGDQVIGGKTKLFQIDSLNLINSVTLSEQGLRLENSSLREKKANCERAEADFYKAELDFQRFQRLSQKGAVTADDFEQQESRYKQTKAMHKHAQALVDLALEKEAQARVKLEIAEKNLMDALVLAPISGKISSRLAEPGEMGQPGKPIVRIDDTTSVEISAFLPAHHYASIVPGKTHIRMTVYGITMPEQVVYYKSPTILPKLRTFEIKSVLNNPPENVIPGALAEIEIVLLQRRGIGVPVSAVQRRGGRSVVFEIHDKRAHMIEVETGIETDGWIEIIDGPISQDTLLVTMGQFLLNEGTPVTIQKEIR